MPSDGDGPRMLRDGIPDVDTSISIVELADVHFDTFDGRSVPLDLTTIDMRRALLDAIRPLNTPAYDPATAGDWLEPGDLVIGYVAGGVAYAYPHKILNFHEIVNDVLDGVPVLVSYCPLCRSGVVYDRRLGDLTLAFSNTSALYESDLVMVDRETGSYWWQVPGRAMVGPLSGEELQPLSSATMRWSDWSAVHPDTRVLSRDTGSLIDYTHDPFAGYAERIDAGDFVFPVSSDSLDDRLTAGTLVVGIEVRGLPRVYAATNSAVINDEVNGEPIVVFTWPGGGTVFSREAAGTVLTFALRDGAIIDGETGSTWLTSGVAAAGGLAGEALANLPARVTFWFAYVGAFPDADAYRE